MTDDFDDAPWVDHRDELYSRVVKRGRFLQFRRRSIVAGSVVAALLLPIGAIAATGRIRDNSAGVAHPGADKTTTTTTTTLPSSDSTNGGVVVPPVSPSTAPSVGPGESTTTTSTTPGTVPGCHNSYDAACGEFRWDPAPPDPNPIGKSLSYRLLGAGEVQFPMVFNGEIASYEIDYGDGSDPYYNSPYPAPTECDPTQPLTNPTGLWSWQADDHSAVEGHTYATGGQYTVTVTVRPQQFFCHPSAFTESTLTVTVDVPNFETPTS
jgi:hypothetical protein